MRGILGLLIVITVSFLIGLGIFIIPPVLFFTFLYFKYIKKTPL
jgi:hypothetical protein